MGAYSKSFSKEVKRSVFFIFGRFKIFGNEQVIGIDRVIDEFI